MPDMTTASWKRGRHEGNSSQPICKSDCICSQAEQGTNDEARQAEGTNYESPITD